MLESITFELVESEQDKKKNKNGKKIFREDYSRVASKIIIRKDRKKIGHIFTASNTIQVCGFTEAFDLWGCGIFEGYKDIQLLFDDGVMGGKPTKSLNNCCRCYRKPCQCETAGHENNPFTVKKECDLKERIIKVKKNAKSKNSEDSKCQD